MDVEDAEGVEIQANPEVDELAVSSRPSLFFTPSFSSSLLSIPPSSCLRLANGTCSYFLQHLFDDVLAIPTTGGTTSSYTTSIANAKEYDVDNPPSAMNEDDFDDIMSVLNQLSNI